MLDKNDLVQIRAIVTEVVEDVVHPKIDALNRKLDRRCDEILAALNEYATVTDRRLARLEAFHA